MAENERPVKLMTVESLTENSKTLRGMFTELRRRLSACQTAGARTRTQTIDNALASLGLVEQAVDGIFDQLKELVKKREDAQVEQVSTEPRSDDPPRL